MTTPSSCPSCRSPLVGELALSSFCPSCRFPLRLLEEKYRLVKEIGKGGFGTIYLAEHLALGQPRVIKLLRTEAFQAKHQTELLARFQREIRVTARLAEGCSNIVRLYDSGYDELLGYYYAMEVLRGFEIRKVLDKHPSLPLPLAFHLMKQALTALGWAHREAVIHRDLKPENLFLTETPSEPCFLKVIDFGIAKALDGTLHPNLTQGVLGSPAYMAPEQWSNKDISPATDVYSLGCIFYELLAGSPLWKVASPSEYLIAHLTYPPEPWSLRCPHRSFPQGLENVLHRALEKDPTLRYPHATAFFDALSPFLAEASSKPWRSLQDHDPSLRIEPTAFSLPSSEDHPAVPPLPSTSPSSPGLPKTSVTPASSNTSWLLFLAFLLGSFGLLGAAFFAGFLAFEFRRPPPPSAPNPTPPTPSPSKFPSAQATSRTITTEPPKKTDTTTLPPPASPNRRKPPRSRRKTSDSFQPLDGLPSGQKRWLPPTTFLMGSPTRFLRAWMGTNEGPLTNVRISRGFWVTKRRITEAQYTFVLGLPPTTSTQAAEVSWHEAASFAVAFSKRSSLPLCFRCFGRGSSQRCHPVERYTACRGWRLPTEAEWEYMAGYKNSALKEVDGQMFRATSGLPYHPLGFFDHLGEEGEWCADGYRENLPGGKVLNPWTAQAGKLRTSRGGAGSIRFWSRTSRHEDRAHPKIGFRIVRSP